MPVEFRWIRTINLAGFSSDPAPNVTPPADSDVFKLQERPPSGQRFTSGNQVVFDFRDGTGAPVLTPTVDWQVWFRDVRSGIWMNALPETGSAPFEAWITEDISNADLFVQVQGLHSLGAAVVLYIRATEV